MTTEKKRKRGPEPKPPHLQRVHRHNIYFNQIEVDLLLTKALPLGTKGMSPKAVQRWIGRYIRDAALSSIPPTIPQINKKAWIDLSRSAANLNQSMALVNKLESDINLIELSNSLVEFRNSMIGVNAEADDESES
jgi:hypothetical protein